MKPRPRKRTLLMVLLLLTGGAIINVAVAWGCTTRIDPTSSTLSGDLRTWIERQPDPLDAAHPVPDLQSFGWMPRPDDDLFHYELALRESRSIGAQTTTIIEHGKFRPGRICFDCGPETRDIVTEVWAGLPMKCLAGSCWWDYHQQPILRGTMWKVREWPTRFVWAIPQVRNVDVFGTKYPYTDILPCRPIVMGFAVNTLFYATILWLLLATLHPRGVVRRRIRARRGQCPACGYPIGTSNVCTECGRAVSRP